MTAARRLPYDKAAPGAEHNHITPAPRRPIIGSRPGHLKDACSAGYAGRGSAPVLDLPARSPEMAATGKQGHPRAQAMTAMDLTSVCPHTRPEPRERP